MLHILNAADGEDLEPPYMFHRGKGWALNLAATMLWMAEHVRWECRSPPSISTIRSTR